MKPEESQDILSLTLDELASRMSAWGKPAYRARQVFEWIYKKKAADYVAMTSLTKDFRELLSRDLPFPVLHEVRRQNSSDGTAKFLWELRDGQRIETVFIPMEDHNTLCISSQAGCKFACGFCASGLGGWKRNLTCGEILGQVLSVQRIVHPRPITHIVFMGVGEPFDNYDNVLKSIRLMNASTGLNIASRRITISTCGVIAGIKRLGEEGKQIELSVSLHAPNNQLRDKLMPVNRKYPLDKLIAACREHAKKKGRQITFEYVLIKDLTCTAQCARELGQLLRGWLSKVNLIVYNPVDEFSYQPPSKSEIDRFQKLLSVEGVHHTLRTPRGRDIAAACGQLRAIRA